MGICGNETNKIYPNLNPTALLQHEVNPQNYRLTKIKKVEAYI